MTTKLPIVTFGGVSPRQRAIRQAMAWQRDVAAENTPTPSRVYAIVVALLAAFPERDVQQAWKAIEKR